MEQGTYHPEVPTSSKELESSNVPQIPIHPTKLVGSKKFKNMPVPSPLVSMSQSIFAQICDDEISVKKFDLFSSIYLGVENLLLLAYDPNDGSVSIVEQHVRGENKEARKKDVTLPPNEEDKEDEDKQPLSWMMNRLKDSKRKGKMTDTGVEGTISYSTRGLEQRLLVDAMKTSKSSTTKKRRLKNLS